MKLFENHGGNTFKPITDEKEIRDMLLSQISDDYKSLHGMRPRGMYQDLSIEELEKISKDLSDQIEREYEQEKKDDEQHNAATKAAMTPKPFTVGDVAKISETEKSTGKWNTRKTRWDAFKSKNKCPHCNGIKLVTPCKQCGGKGYIKEITHPDDVIDQQGDGYKNDAQRAFANSQMTTPKENDTAKANELAAQGKYVVMTINNAHCKSTDAVLGQHQTIHSVNDNMTDAQKSAGEVYNNCDDVRIISPESIAAKTPVAPTTPEVDDVPFECIGRNQFKLKDTSINEAYGKFISAFKNHPFPNDPEWIEYSKKENFIKRRNDDKLLTESQKKDNSKRFMEEAGVLFEDLKASFGK